MLLISNYFYIDCLVEQALIFINIKEYIVKFNSPMATF